MFVRDVEVGSDDAVDIDLISEVSQVFGGAAFHLFFERFIVCARFSFLFLVLSRASLSR